MGATEGSREAGGGAGLWREIMHGALGPAGTRAVNLQGEEGGFAGSVPALLALNAPLIGLGVMQIRVCRSPDWVVEELSRPPALIFSAASQFLSPAP